MHILGLRVPYFELGLSTQFKNIELSHFLAYFVHNRKKKKRWPEWVKGKTIGFGLHGMVHLAINKATGALFVAKSAVWGYSSISRE